MAREGRSLRGRVAAVTGGARGIGRATAAALAREGARVAIGDLDADLARSTADQVGHDAGAFALDVTRRDSFEHFLDSVEEAFGPLDILVNNAGIMHLGRFVDEDDATTARQVDINLLGVLTGTKLALERMDRRGTGHIVNLASSAGKVSPPGAATYAATKHAVVGLTEAVAAEHRESGIEFSIVMPGVVNTELAAGLAKGRAVKWVEPEEVADAIVEALRKPRLEVYVPSSIGTINRITAMLPRRAQEAIGRALKVDRILWDADQSRRAAYEARAAASEPQQTEDAGGATAGQEQVPAGR
jgi:NAD(P)-dependent dehydrogenase (short-subunit alcohol dehydrogenase family)